MIPALQRRASEENIALLGRLARRLPVAGQALRGIELRRAVAAAEQQRREEAERAAEQLRREEAERAAAAEANLRRRAEHGTPEEKREAQGILRARAARQRAAAQAAAAQAAAPAAAGNARRRTRRKARKNKGTRRA